MGEKRQKEEYAWLWARTGLLSNNVVPIIAIVLDGGLHLNLIELGTKIPSIFQAKSYSWRCSMFHRQTFGDSEVQQLDIK